MALPLELSAQAMLLNKDVGFTGEIRGNPAYRSSSTGMWTGGSSSIRPVKFTQKWMEDYQESQKKGESVFLRYGLNDSATVILGWSSRKEPIPEGTRGLHPARLCSASFATGWFLDNFALEIALTGNEAFTDVVSVSPDLPSHLRIGYDEVRACHAPANGALLEGQANVQFVRKGVRDPVGFFSGVFHEGKPEGPGVFLAPYTEGGKAVHPDVLNDKNDPVFLVRAGTWRKGALLEEPGARAKSEQAAMAVIRDQLKLLPAEGSATVEVVQQYFLKDTLNEAYTNKAQIIAKVSWKDSVDKSISRWAWYRLSILDFYDMNPTVTLLGLDPVSSKAYAALMASEDRNFVKGFLVFGDSRYLADDYTEVRESPVYPRYFGLTCWPDRAYEYNCIDVQIRKRKLRSAPFELVASHTLVDVWRNCDEAHSALDTWLGGWFREGNYHRWNKETNGLSLAMGNKQEAMRLLLDEARKLHPDPADDKTLAPRTGDANEKVEEVLRRLRTSPRCAFDPTDTLAGIWYRGTDPASPIEIMYIPPAVNKVFYKVKVGDIKLKRDYHTNFLKETVERNGMQLRKSAEYAFPILSLSPDEVVFGDYRFTNLRETYKRLPMEMAERQ